MIADMHIRPFLSAEDGLIHVWDQGTSYEDDPDFVGSPADVAKWLSTENHDGFACSSSMRFGTQYGFKQDNVRHLVLNAQWKLSMTRYKD